MPEANPYEPPATELGSTPSAEDHGGPASQGQRVANVLLDTFMFYVLSFALGVGVGLTAGTEALEGPLGSMIGVPLMITYYVVCEGAFGRTIGKMITGTKVIDEQGQPPSFLKVFGRTLSRFVPFEVFSFGGSHPEGWHDRWSGTRVVRVRK